MADPAVLERPVSLAELHLELLAASFEERSPQDLLRWAIGCYGRELAIATSFQAEGMVLLDMAWRIDPGIRRRFAREGYLYVRNFGDGFGLSWQEAFGTSDPAAVESYCREQEIDFEWKPGGRLRTSALREAASCRAGCAAAGSSMSEQGGTGRP